MSNFLNKYKSVYDVFLDNWSYQSHFVLYLEALMRQQTLLPTYIKEMIFAYISGLNGCQYCKNIHAEISKKLLRMTFALICSGSCLRIATAVDAIL